MHNTRMKDPGSGIVGSWIQDSGIQAPGFGIMPGCRILDPRFRCNFHLSELWKLVCKCVLCVLCLFCRQTKSWGVRKLVQKACLKSWFRLHSGRSRKLSRQLGERVYRQSNHNLISGLEVTLLFMKGPRAPQERPPEMKLEGSM